MKRLQVLLLVALSSTFLMFGCGKEEVSLNIKEDFIEIQSITYTTYYTEEDENYYKQKNSSLYSRFYIDAEINYEVTEDGFIDSEGHYRIFLKFCFD